MTEWMTGQWSEWRSETSELSTVRDIMSQLTPSPWGTTQWMMGWMAQWKTKWLPSEWCSELCSDWPSEYRSEWRDERQDDEVNDALNDSVKDPVNDSVNDSVKNSVNDAVDVWSARSLESCPFKSSTNFLIAKGQSYITRAANICIVQSGRFCTTIRKIF